VGALRSQCSASSAVERVAANVYHVRNFLADIYGVRVGSQVLLFDAEMDSQATPSTTCFTRKRRNGLFHARLFFTMR